MKAWIAAGGLGPIPPTISEVAEELQVSTSTAREWLETAVKDGLMVKAAGRARGFSLSDAGRRVFGGG